MNNSKPECPGNLETNGWPILADVVRLSSSPATPWTKRMDVDHSVERVRSGGPRMNVALDQEVSENADEDTVKQRMTEDGGRRTLNQHSSCCPIRVWSWFLSAQGETDSRTRLGWKGSRANHGCIARAFWAHVPIPTPLPSKETPRGDTQGWAGATSNPAFLSLPRELWLIYDPAPAFGWFDTSAQSLGG